MKSIETLKPDLHQKLQQAIYVIEDAFDSFAPEQTAVAWSAGKDSTLMLYLICEVCQQQQLQLPVALDIDQHDQFTELEAFRDRIARDWAVNVIMLKNKNFLSKVTAIGQSVDINTLDATNRHEISRLTEDQEVTWQPDSPVCNHLLKTLPFNQAMEENHFKALFTGIRWDEHGARESESYFSPRQNPDHTRIHPILHLTEQEIWDVNFGLELPFCELYYQGYRSLGSKTGTVKPSDIPAWKQDLVGTTERGGRSEEKEKMMEQLRALGYL